MSRLLPEFRVAGLFAGIGGLELGFHKAGFETELLCEIEPAAQCVLRAGFPGIELVSDVRNITELPPHINVVTAGFPCQDLSSSGLKEGIRGHQSSLVHELFRLLRKRPIEWVVIENVPFMLRLQRGAAIRAVVDGLESLGYSWAYRVVDSHALGVPHRRKRVFVVASLTHDPRGILLGTNNPNFEQTVSIRGRTIDKPVGFYWTEGTYATGLAFNAIPPLKGGSTIGIPSPPAVLFPDGSVVTPDIKDAEALQGFPVNWTEPAEGVLKPSHRWKLLGNAVTVNVAAWLAQRIKLLPEYKGVGDTPLAGREPWPEAAWSLIGERYRATCSHYPSGGSPVGLDEFLKYSGKPLSRRAIDGFLTRAKKGGLWYPEGFLRDLDRYANGVAVSSS